MTRKAEPTTSTMRVLITRAAGKCEFEGCTAKMEIDGKPIGEVAHIAAASKSGPRYDQNLTIEEKRDVENLMFLCPNHHKMIDNIPEKYTSKILHKIKKKHEKNSTKHNMKESVINEFAWKIQFDRYSRGTITSIPKTINTKTIAREDQVSALLKQVEQLNKVIIVGNKGSGKSVMLAQLSEHLMDMRKNVLFIKCDEYLEIDDLSELKKIMGDGVDILEVIDNMFDEDNPLVVICDSLDAISRNTKSINLFKRFLNLLWGTKKVKTICSVRSYDYEYSPIIKQTEWGQKYDLVLLTDKELDKTLAELGSPCISTDLKNILHNPLHLKLLSLILERSPDANFTNIKNEIELYDEHWNNYVEKLEDTQHIRETLFEIAKKMSTDQKISISYDGFDKLPGMQEIQSRNIIIQDNYTYTISFFHHAYLDYVMSRFIIARHNEFVDYLSSNEYNVFLRPTIVFALAVLHKHDPVKSIKVIEKILKSSLKYFWKISSLTALARIDKSDGQNFTNLGKHLSMDLALQRHFLMEIKKHGNVFWFDLWKESFLLNWSSVEYGNGVFIVEYLKSIVKFEDNQHVFKLLQLIITHNNGLPVRYAVQLSSEIDFKGKKEWLCELSTSNDTYIRNGMVDGLVKLIEMNPKIVPSVFCNLFTHIETSDEQTQPIRYGTMVMTSTVKQDNQMVVGKAVEIFPELLKKDPAHMITATIMIFEILKKNYLANKQGYVVEDYGFRWFNLGLERDENKLLKNIIEYVKECPDQILTEIIPIFKSTKLATFHLILLDALIYRKNSLLDEIIQIMLEPQVYEIQSLRKILRTAIKQIWPLLKHNQIKKILDLVMNIKPWKNELDEAGKKLLNKIKCEFLSEFPKDELQTQHHKLLNKFSKNDLKYKEPVKYSITIGETPESISGKKQNPEDIISNNIGNKLDHKEKINLLKAISEYFDRKTENLDKTKIQSIKTFLIKNGDESNSQNNIEGKDNFSSIHPTIRRLVIKCLIQLLIHSKDATLVSIVRRLANDPTDVVKEEVCDHIRELFEYDYDLAYSIVKPYSMDPNTKITNYLYDTFDLLCSKNPAHATLIVKNMLNTLDHKKLKGLEELLIILAFHEKEKDAINLLDKITKHELFPSEARCNIPYVLSKYLFDEEFQDQSLELLYRLLDDPDYKVREKAAFFTLNSFVNDDSVGYENFLKKIGKHLERISSEINRKPWNPELLEHLVRFLEKFWHSLPDKTIDYLEKMLDEKILMYSAYQPVLAEGSVAILTRLLQHNLVPENQIRCFDILDKYVMAGWPAALELLSTMERPD